MRLVKSLFTLYGSVRANLLGGWTDQLLWNEKAAVINFALGWRDKKCWEGHYPLMLDRLGRFHSAVSGIGTGLGISSIRAAMYYLQAFPEREEDYIRFVLEYEKAMLGTEGGWEDQIGGINPGFKLITTPAEENRRHQQFAIQHYDDHPILARTILFDSKIRRRAGDIGDVVRHLMLNNEKFRSHLRTVAEMAEECFYESADEMIDACNYSWKKFVRFVPAMALPKPLPKTNLIAGHMLLGAGGGGFGLVFVKKEQNRKEVINLLNCADFWATEPVLTDGIKIVTH